MKKIHKKSLVEILTQIALYQFQRKMKKNARTFDKMGGLTGYTFYKIRKNLNLTQEDFAEDLGVSLSKYRKAEKGEWESVKYVNFIFLMTYGDVINNIYLSKCK